jgi:predicted nucleic acid-binding protein
MSDRHFLDTNIFVYTFDASDRRKCLLAADLVHTTLRERIGIISFQVVQEFCSIATRKFAKPFTLPELRRYLDRVLGPLCEVHSSPDLYRSCLDIRGQTGYSVYDSLIVAAAISAQCTVLYSEDLEDGRRIGGVRIVNPFA